MCCLGREKAYRLDGAHYVWLSHTNSIPPFESPTGYYTQNRRLGGDDDSITQGHWKPGFERAVVRGSNSGQWCEVG